MSCGPLAGTKVRGVGVGEGEGGRLNVNGSAGEDGHGLVYHLLPHLLYELLFLHLQK